MKKKFIGAPRSPFSMGIRMTPMERRAGRLLRGPDHNSGTGGEGVTPEPKQTPEQKQTPEPKTDPKPEDLTAAQVALKAAEDRATLAEAEAEKARAVAARFKGIDPDKARENDQKVKDAEEAARKAEVEKAKAEGNFERLREIQNEEHQSLVSSITTERDANAKRADEAEARLAKALVTTAFASSKFVAEDTILGASKAARLYGEFVDFEDGKVVVYDGPRGERRAKVMDARGNALPFDEAIRKVIEADPDKDAFLKNKTKPGAGSKTAHGATPAPSASRLDRISAGLKAINQK